jgi:hypothetical protein
MPVVQYFQWIQDTQLASSFRESTYVFPIVEGIHVLALALSVGTVMWFDLRLVGVTMRGQPVSKVFGPIKPWMFTGFGIMFSSGVMLFLAHALQCYESIYFRVKAALLFMALINVVIYHLTIDRTKYEWDKAPIPPLGARMAGIISLVLWTAIIAVGRLMAYNL